MLALIATLAIQALATMTVLAPPVFVGVAAPDIGVGVNAIGVFTAIIYATACISAGGAGGPVRRWGAIRVSQASLVIGGIGLGLVATGSLAVAALGAALIGFGYGPMTPASSHILIRQTPPERRALIFSIKQTGVPLGGALAGLLVPPLTLAFGWQDAALAVGGASILLAIACEKLHRTLDDDADPQAKGEQHILAALRLVWSMPGLRRLSLASVVYSAMQLCVSAFIVTFLTERVGLHLVTAGIVMAATQASGVVGRILWGWLSDRLVTARQALALLGYAIAMTGAGLALVGADWPLIAVFATASAPRLRHHHAHRLARLKPIEAGTAQRRHMDEDVLGAVIRQDETEAARRVVPFYDAVKRLGRASAHIFHAAAHAAVLARPEAAFARRVRRCGRGVEVEHLRGGTALGALHPFEGDAGTVRRLAEAGTFEHRQRQEDVTRPVIRHDEAEPLAAVEPLDLAGQP